MRKSRSYRDGFFAKDQFSLDQIDKIQAMYDQIYEQNQSYKQSLLVSPHCSKYERSAKSPNLAKHRNYNNEDAELEESLAQYIKPFNFQQLTKTQTKQKMRRKKQVDVRKKTQHSWEESSLDSKCANLQKMVAQLRISNEEKDNKISVLQKQLVYIMQVNATRPSYSAMNSPYQKESFSKSKECPCELENLKKEIVFLSKNNQQLYEQVYRIKNMNKKLEHVLQKSLLYGRELETKLVDFDHHAQDLKEQNRELKIQRQEMINNYQEQIRLFLKMKKVWKVQQSSQQLQKQKQNIKRSKSRTEFKKKQQYY